jgi:8-oxo-dGTP diphosphatase
MVDDQQRLLLTWWNGEGRGIPGWSMPGGGVEYEEPLTEAVEREVLLETGYLVEVGSPIAAHSFTIPDGGRDGRP